MSERYGAFTFRVVCRHCGQPGPLDLPAREHVCAFCQQEMAVPAVLFGDLLELFDDEHDALGPGETESYEDEAQGITATVSYRQVDKPRCEKCKEPFRDESIMDGSARDIFCASCGDPASTAPVPAWLAALVPTARQIVSIHRGAAGGVGLSPELPPEATQPIAMACPSCGAGLTITHEHARATPCTFCKVSVYLPDALWRRLHPVRTVQEWFVGFAGPSARARAAEKTRAEEEASTATRAEEDTTEARGTARTFLVLSAMLGALGLAYLVATLAFGLAVPPAHWLIWILLLVVLQLSFAVGTGSHAFAVIRARVGSRAQPFVNRVTTAALLGMLPIPLGAWLYRGIHRDLAQIPGMKPRDLAPLGLCFVLQTILVPLHVALIVPGYLTLGSCPDGQSFDQTGHCFRCGARGEPSCYAAKGRRSCRAPFVLDPSGRFCR